MKFEIIHATWDVEDEMEENGILTYDAAVENFDLPTGDFDIEIDYEFEGPEAGPTKEEAVEIEKLLSDKISDEYGFRILYLEWKLIE